MPNRLANETSPYLLQHANNPVDWYPWGSEALERARREDRPILLSIGYAACHWCHVMEHESFENDGIARLMNERFVNIKVDREERPDLDSIYMQAVQAMTGQGGWPMTMFLTPAGEPFFGGTYFPPTDRHGIPGFPRVLEAISTSWASDRERVMHAGAQLREMYASGARSLRGTGSAGAATLERAYRGMAGQFDEVHAGFGGAPKFPPSMGLEFLLTHWARTGTTRALELALRTFRAMAAGGIYDQVGGGLHRYSVDAQWLVPHFEKMLYDNALFVRLGVHLWQATGDSEVRRVVEQTVTWLEREMTSPHGGFYSSLDADSEGHEGRFYVWTDDELDQLLGADAFVARAAWSVSPGGNFEGASILYVPNELAAVAARAGSSVEEVERVLERARGVLYAARAQRVWPGCDDKVLAGWNGLMLRALVEVARAFGDDSARALALRNAVFLRDTLIRDGRALRSWRAGKTQAVGFLEDQASIALAFLDVFSLTGDPAWLHLAREMTTRGVENFHDPAAGLFFDTPRDHEALITRPRDVTDNALPAGSSLMAELLLRVAVIDDRADLRELGEGIVHSLADAMGQYPAGFGHLLGAADLLVHGAVEVAITGDPMSEGRRALEAALGRRYVPSLVWATAASAGDAETALTRGKWNERAPTAYVCRRYVCSAPASEPTRLIEELTLATQPAQA
ncbi:MAG: thioredoxin domain-containing protein [Cytophagaceae bacterium]|nr:thioredoxin domain-containing protein [Gemmatimonadaceae bacterium]